MCALREAKPGNLQSPKRQVQVTGLSFRSSLFPEEVGMQDRGLEKAGGGCKAGGKAENPPPQSFIFVFPNSAAFPWHSQDTSEQGGSRWEQGEKGRKERKRESVKGTVVPKCNNIKK